MRKNTLLAVTGISLMVLMAFSIALWLASLLTLWLFRRARHLNHHRHEQRALALASSTNPRF